ncbi:mitochondrial carrier protein MTM1-like [Lactuca sativa]|uniref:mitochondrial carrier protein MTM1-like n=1 Tax=Lactuca sativa TaxID=4236 RepID=UPI0022AFBA84|nr:mitochondrial carrier protein MTM1-like [Lactuca sativa]
MTNLTSRMAVFGPNMMFTDLRCSPSCTRAGVHGTEGFGRLWRGTNAGLALAIPTVGIYLPCYDIFQNWFEEFATENAPSMTPYAPLLVGTMAGGAADCQFWHRNLGIKCHLHELANKSRISVTGASKMLANILYFLPWDGAKQSFYAALLFFTAKADVSRD